jgi:hypothetical protein
VFFLEPISEADGVVTARLVDRGCYKSDSRAFFVGSGGVRVPERLADKSLTDKIIRRYTTQSHLRGGGDFLIGREWDDLGFSGDNVEYFADRGCANTTWQVANVGLAWNDRFQSGKGFANCDHNRKFEHTQFNGAVLLCTPNCNNYGALNNEVSSLRWKD